MLASSDGHVIGMSVAAGISRAYGFTSASNISANTTGFDGRGQSGVVTKEAEAQATGPRPQR